MLSISRRSGRSALVVLLALSAGSCAKKQETTENTTPAESTMTTPAPAAPAMSDANIAAVVIAANDADIDNGKEAKGKTKNLKVREFAVQMITDHTAVNKQVHDLASKLSLSPEDNDASKGLKASSDAVRDSLKKMDGAAFDKAYIDNEIAYHEQVINTIDSALIPSAQNPDLKSLLENVRPAIQAHLDHAKQVQSELAK